MKKLLKIVGTVLGSFIFLIICGIVVFIIALNVFIDPPVPNPYEGKELTITQLLPTYKLSDIRWQSDVYINSIEKISPDKKKTTLLVSHGTKSCVCNHTILVRDLEKNTLTPIVTLREADPGSGRSFDYYWSKDSNLLKIEGQQSINGHPIEFEYIYDHNKKKLFKS